MWMDVESWWQSLRLTRRIELPTVFERVLSILPLVFLYDDHDNLFPIFSMRLAIVSLLVKIKIKVVATPTYWLDPQTPFRII